MLDQDGSRVLVQDGSTVLVRDGCKKIHTVARSALASKRLDQTNWIKNMETGRF